MSVSRALGTADLQALIADVGQDLAGSGCLYLLGQTSHLAAGWRSEVERFDLAGEPLAGDLRALRDAVHASASRLGTAVAWEHPGDVIPLPDGAADRVRPTDLNPLGSVDGLTVRHFDPYSVVFRAIARGDEQDYRTALGYLAGGWVTIDGLETSLERTLSRFTKETILQDPAEFRRKFRGLRQMWRATEGATARTGRQGTPTG